MNTVYKVCRGVNGEYRSTYPPEFGGRFDLAYEISAETRAVEGSIGLLVFPDLEDAARFCQWDACPQWDWHVLKCTTEHEPQRRERILRRASSKLGYWTDQQKRDASRFTPRPAPHGTYTVPSLTPVAEVTYEEWRVNHEQG